MPAYSILWPANTKCHIKSSTRTTTSLVPTRFFHRHTHIHTRSQHTRSVIQATKIKRLKEKNGQCVVALKTWKGKKKKKCAGSQSPPLEKTVRCPPETGKRGLIHRHTTVTTRGHCTSSCKVCVPASEWHGCHQALLVACGRRRPRSQSSPLQASSGQGRKSSFWHKPKAKLAQGSNLHCELKQ